MKKCILPTLISFFFWYGLTFPQASATKPKPPRTNLHIAIIQGNLKVVQQHIAAGTDLDMKEPEAGSTPLITAATFGRSAAASALVEAGVDLDLQNNDGSTALLTAAFFCRVDIVKMLLDKGADKTLANHRGVTPLQAVSGSFEETKPIYEYIEKSLSPLNFRLDYGFLEKTRPEVADLLR